MSASWEETTLGAAGEWLSGGTPAKADGAMWAGTLPWVSPKDMKRARLSDAIDHVAPEAVGNGTSLAPAGALLMVVRGMILAHTFPVALTTAPLAFNQDIKALVPGDGWSAEFLLYWLESRSKRLLELVDVSNHGTKRLGSDRLFAEPLPRPPLAEQRKIAAILSSVDDAIAATQAVIDQLQVVKKAMMAELLTRGLPGRHTKFKMTEIGEVPASWQVTTLGDVAVDGPTNGIYKPAHLIGRGSLVVGMTAIDDGTLDWSMCRRAQLEAREQDRFGLRARDLLITRVFARADGIGRFVLVPEVPEPSSYESNMMRLRVATDRTLPEFVAAYMSLPSVRAQVQARATLGVQASINNDAVRSLPLRLPPLDEQASIVAVLATVQGRVRADHVAIGALRDLKSALLHVLLTGEVRVTP